MPNDNLPSGTSDATPDEHDDSAASAAAAPVHAAIDQAADAVSSAARRAQEGAASVRDALDRCVDEACHLGAECAESARTTVRARPLAAIAGALAVGLLIGRLCR